MDCTADMLLTFVWDNTASGNSKEHNVPDIKLFVLGDLNKDKLNKGLGMAEYILLCSTCLH